MRLIVALLMALVVALPAWAQSSPETHRSAASPKQPPPQADPTGATAKKAVAPKTAKKGAAKAAAIPRATPAETAHYAAMPAAERRAIQSDLVWTGDYNGIPSDDFGDRSIAAVRSYQARSGAPETGILTPEQRAALAAAAQAKQQASGWRVVVDAVSGIRLAIPVKRVKDGVPTRTGTRWSSEQGQVQIETFRIAEAGAALAAVFEQQKKEPKSRRVEYSVMRDNFFVLSGQQGLKRFYVRAHAQDNEVRGMLVLYDQAVMGIMDPIAVAMSSRFEPFPTAATASARKRQVEYATGVVVNRDGHVITDRQATDGCNTITLAGLGSAVLVGETADVALLRVYGVADLKPAVLVGGGMSPSDATLVGIADPQTQNGNAAVSSAAARIGPVLGATRALDSAPPLGFSGAPAVDPQGRVVGLAVLKPTVVAGPDAGPQARLVPAGEIRSFLVSRSVAVSDAASSPDGARASVVRVICVRK
jgi:peptidoglycan hydrolase-like protein with peptidoglycan-binding domain